MPKRSLEEATQFLTLACLLAPPSDMDVGTSTWGQQFAEAITCAGEDADEDPSRMDYFMHFLTLGWKVVFAFTPPTQYCGGWGTFIVSLAFIGILTGFVGDIAATFG